MIEITLMLNNYKLVRLSILLLILSIIFLSISGRGCSKRGRIRKDSSSNSSFTITAPSNLTAITVSPSQINLSWIDNSGGKAQYFWIERKMGAGGSWARVNTTTLNSYSDSGLAPMTTYYYRIQAWDNIGDYSEYSNEAYATTFELVWSAVAGSLNHTFAIANDKTLWAWGSNDVGQLGVGDITNRNRPTLIASDWNYLVFDNIDSVAAGSRHTITRKTDGTLWAWGVNGSGQLGIDGTDSVEAPFPIGTDYDWSAIAAGSWHTLAIKTNNTLWSWGYNASGQLGLGDSGNGTSRLTPTQLDTNSDWLTIAGGGDDITGHSIAIKTNRTIWSWGNNQFYQLGLDDLTYRNTPSQIGNDTDWFLVTAGNKYNIARKINGTIWGWGQNNDFQLGLGDSNARITPTKIGNSSDWSAVTAGWSHAFACKTNGTIWGWGNNSNGQLGLGNTIGPSITPKQVGNSTDWIAISAGNSHTIALKNNGTIWVWGDNSNRQLGLGDTIDRNIPYPIGSPAIPSSLIASLISLWRIDLSWTDNASNEKGFKIERKSGNNGTWEEIKIVGLDITSYSDITGTGFAYGTTYYYRVRAYNDLIDSPYSNEAWMALSGNWSAIAAGYVHNIARKTDRTIWSWGYNRIPQTQVGADSDWSTLAACGGSYDESSSTFTYPFAMGDGPAPDFSMYTLAIKTNGAIWAWGNNLYGQLGVGDQNDRTTPTQIIAGTDSDWSTVRAGEFHTIAYKTNNTLWAWGLNTDGQLGIGNTNNRNTPAQIIIGTDIDWATNSFDAGFYHTIAINTNGSLWAWGLNDDSQLGLGDITKRTTPSRIGSETNWSTVAAGGYHTIAHKVNKTIWAWGKNNYGQLGLGGTISRITPSSIGTSSDWSVVEAGAFHTIAITTNKVIWVWGRNNNGQLGMGDTTDRSTPTQMGIDTDWVTIMAGGDYTLGLKINNTIWSWGRNNYGQLGLGDAQNRNVPTLMGE